MSGWLTIDRGNTTLDCSLTPSGVEAADGLRARLDPGEPGALSRFLARHDPVRAIGASVVPAGLDSVRAELAAAGLELLVAGVDLPCPLRVAYPDPASLGVDRWLGALAACRDYGTAVTVDCGTAVTVNLVTAGAEFLGGCIAPGLRTAAAGLERCAPALPPADLELAVELPALDSKAAVAAGVQLGFCGLVEGLVARVTAAAGCHGVPCLLTGGDAEFVLRYSDLACVHVPDLVHRGMRWLLADHSSC